MSDSEESAIDNLVEEVFEGRAAAEAAGAPPGTPLTTDEGDVEDDDFVDSDDEVEYEGAASSGEVAQLRAERDSFLADTQRLTADFANYRKQSDKRVLEAAATQSASLVRDLIPILDACDSAIVQDEDSAVLPIRRALISELEKNGLELLAPTENEVFDPEQHEAVIHEPAPDDADFDGQVVGEVFRAGYTWKGRVVRPAMVKVIG